MFARILPASKTGQVILGPIDQNLLPPLNQSLALTLCRPANAGQKKLREQICGRRAHQRRGGGQLPFGATNIRTPPEQIGGQPNQHFRRQAGNFRFFRQLAPKRAGL